MSAELKLINAMLPYLAGLTGSEDRELAAEAAQEHSKLSSKKAKLLKAEVKSAEPQLQEVGS